MGPLPSLWGGDALVWWVSSACRAALFVLFVRYVVLVVFDAGVHGACGLVAAIVGVGNMVPPVCAVAAAFISFRGESAAVVEGEGECVAVIVHVGGGGVGVVVSA